MQKESNDEDDQVEHFARARNQHHRLEEDEKAFNGRTRQQLQSDKNNTEDPDLDDIQEEQVYLDKLKAAIQESYLSTLKTLSLADRDVIAYQRGLKILEKKKTKQFLRRTKRKLQRE